MKTLYLIRGVPGSGKSSFADSLFKCGLVDMHLEADMFFLDDVTGQYTFNPHELGLAHKWCQDNTIVMLSAGYSVAVSNTSTTEREVEVYRQIAEDYDAKFVSLVMENRHNGVNIHNVPAEKIQQMKSRFSVKL